GTDDDAERPIGRLIHLGAEDEPGLSTAGSGGEVEPLRCDAHLRELLLELQRRVDVAERADGAGAPDGDDIRPLSTLTDPRRDLLADRLVRGARDVTLGAREDVDLGAEEMVEEKVALRLRIADLRGHDERAPQPGDTSRRGCLAVVIRLHGTGRDERGRPLT